MLSSMFGPLFASFGGVSYPLTYAEGETESTETDNPEGDDDQ